ncbi:MAG: heme biosynthesis protein, partial [Nannocystaceae bacterium]
RSCEHADRCRSGCTWTSHVLFGRSGNNPYCHHRALKLEQQGLRERIRLVEPAAGLPFDHGRYEIVVEPNTIADDDRATSPVPLAMLAELFGVEPQAESLWPKDTLIQLTRKRPPSP